MKPSVRFPPRLRSGATRRRLRRLMVDIERHGGETLEGPLRRALDDETLRVTFWIPERGGWVDAAGQHVEHPPPGADRAVTHVQGPDGPLAALIHDPRLRRDRRLLEAVVAVARLALENERLEAELLARIKEVRASRARIVATGDAERSRIERDLHDGAQQRLVSLSLGLQMVGIRLEENGDASARELLAHGTRVAAEAIEELRVLAHGLFPAVLADEGLAAALEDLAAAGPIAMELAETPEGRVDRTAEAAAYFAVVEAIGTAARHDAAAEVRVAARVARDHLELIVEPLAGRAGDLRSLELEDRVDAVGGTVTSERGHLRVEIPMRGAPG